MALELMPLIATGNKVARVEHPQTPKRNTQQPYSPRSPLTCYNCGVKTIWRSSQIQEYWSKWCQHEVKQESKGRQNSTITRNSPNARQLECCARRIYLDQV